jgi:hypothetical protein
MDKIDLVLASLFIGLVLFWLSVKPIIGVLLFLGYGIIWFMERKKKKKKK